MKWLTIILCSVTITSAATECSNSYYVRSHLTWDYCQNYTAYSWSNYYRVYGEASLLNAYVEQLIAQKKLPDKKVCIVSGTLYGSAIISLSQTDSTLEIYMDNYSPKLEMFARIIDYFTRPEWKPFNEGGVQWGVDSLFESIISKNSKYDSDFFIGKRISCDTICSAEDTAYVYYLNQNVYCRFNNQDITINGDYHRPVLIYDRLVLVNTDSAYVFGPGFTKATPLIPENRKRQYYILSGMLWCEAHSAGVGIFAGTEQPFMIYDYDKNIFRYFYFPY